MYLDQLSYIFLIIITICCLQQNSFATAIGSQSHEPEGTVTTETITSMTAITVIVSQVPPSQSSNSEDKFWVPVSSTPTYDSTKGSNTSAEKHETAVCTATMLHFPKFTMGSTKTIYPSTRIETVYIDCEGCDTLVTRNVGGHGPVVFVTTTVTNETPTTSTTFKCSLALDFTREIGLMSD